MLFIFHCFGKFFAYISLLVVMTHVALSGSTMLSPVIVTAQKSKLNLSVDTINVKDISDNQYQRVTDVITFMPGVFVAQSGSSGQQTSVFIRGGNSAHTSVIVDGMNAADPATGTFNFAGLGTEGASIITVSRGVSVAEGKTDALSGAIEIETRRGQNSIDDTSRFDAKIEGGSHDTYTLESGFEGESGQIDYHVRILHDQSQGTVTTPNRLQTTSRQRQADPSDRTHFVARTGVQLNDMWRLNFWNHIQKSDDYSYSPVKLNPAQHGFTTRNFHRAEAEIMLDSYRQKVGYSFALTERKDESEYAPYDPVQATKGRIDSVYFKNEKQFSPFYSLLTHLTHERQERVNNTQFEQPQRNRVVHQTVGVGHKITPVEAWHIEAWGRWHHCSAFKHRYSTKVKTDYTISRTGTTLLASYGTGVRTPSLAELYDTRGGNSNLKPEQSKGYDIGIEQDVIAKRIRVGSTYFRQDFEDLIISVPVQPLVWNYKNVNAARTYGLESFIEAKLGEWSTFFDTKSTLKPPVTLRFEHTFLHTKDMQKNAQLQRRPMHKLAINAMWQVNENMLLGMGFMSYGKRADIDHVNYHQVYRSGPAVFRVFGSYYVNKKVEFFGRIENAGNSRAEYPEGYAMPGVSGYVGVKIKGAF